MTLLDTTRLLPAPAAPAATPPLRRARRHRGRRSWTAWVLLVLLVAGAGYGGWLLVQQRIADSAQVSLDQVALTAVPIPVGSPDAAVVDSVAVRAGDTVRSGQTLAVLDLTPASDGTPRSVTLRAPGDGNVVQVDAQPGSVVRAGEPVVTLYDPSTLTFQAQLPVNDVEGLQAGMLATIDGPGVAAPVQARVQRVVPVIAGAVNDPATLTVVLAPVDPDDVASLVPGVPLHGSLDTTTGAGAGSVLDSGA